MRVNQLAHVTTFLILAMASLRLPISGRAGW
jgi:hypothetical protein